jgi:hypothetical protein
LLDVLLNLVFHEDHKCLNVYDYFFSLSIKMQ